MSLHDSAMLRASSLKILSTEQLCCCTALTALNIISVRAEYPGHRRWALRVRHSSWGAVVKSTVRITVFISLQGRVTQSQALCSTSPAGQHNLAAVWPPKTHNHTLNFHIVAWKYGHNFPSFTLPHTFLFHTIRESWHRGNRREIWERKLETPCLHPGWKHLQLWSRKTSAERSAANGKHIPLFSKTWYLSKCNLPVPAPDGTLCFLSGWWDEQKVHSATPPK